MGARNEGSLATGSGAAYVFHRENDAWAQEAYLKASNAREGDQFGFSVAILGDIVAVGTTSEDSSAVGVNGDQFSTGQLHSGAAYVFRREGMGWVQEAYVKASNTDSNDNFGYQVAISNDSLVITAPFEDSDATGVGGSQVNGDLENPGAFYLFQ